MVTTLGKLVEAVEAAGAGAESFTFLAVGEEGIGRWMTGAELLIWFSANFPASAR